MRIDACRTKNLANTLIASLVFAASVTSSNVHADEADALNFLVGETITYDDNLFRISDSASDQTLSGTSNRDTKRSDMVSTTYLGVTFDKLLSRQNLHADILYNINRYSHYSTLDYNGLRANANWGWQLGNYLKGSLAYERNRTLVDFGSLNPEDRDNARDVNTYDRFYASADWWFHPEYSFGVGYSRSASSYTSAQRQANEYDADAVELNAKFQPNSGNLIGLSLRQTKGRYPNRQTSPNPVGGNVVATVDNSFDQTDAEVNGDWRLTGQSRFFGRLGYTTRTHDQVSERDFSGLTGRLTYDWAFDGKTNLNIGIRREIGAVDDIDAAYVLTDGVSLNPVWNPTSKISLAGKYDWSKRRYEGDPFRVIGAGTNPSLQSVRKDTVNTASVSGTYTPLRSLRLILTLQHERRSSTREFVPYRDNLASFSAQLSF
ncbi:MAG: putative exosortase B-associated extracellular polysaccharide biosynthesis transporter EpsL [Sterolibacteriaceae bacterium]|nr:putative exosortase B-associated extracellular polysaccharide biosynthesis transporter EpsL [Candidatus Methylophosphatis haderslevensis]